jgi:hypothetical protein
MIKKRKKSAKSKDIYKCRPLQRKDERAAAGGTHGMPLPGIREK